MLFLQLMISSGPNYRKNALSKIIEFSDLFEDAVYIGFPWATLFDYLKQNQISKSEKLLSVYQNLKKKINNKKNYNSLPTYTSFEIYKILRGYEHNRCLLVSLYKRDL